MTRKTLVRIYSMTKCIVATGIMQLVQDGLLGLDDKLSDHIPLFASVRVLCEKKDGMPDHDRTVTPRRPILIRHLLTHTSGIASGLAPGLDGPKIRSTLERAWASIYTPLVERVHRGDIRNLGHWVQELATLPLIGHPGSHYDYGYSYDVLGYLIELKSGMKLHTYLQRRIFRPLGMRDTCFDLSTSSSSMHARLSVLYRYTKSGNFGSDGRKYRLVRVDPAKRGSRSVWADRCLVPSAGGCLSNFEGGLLSTLDDYTSFLLTITNGGVHPTTGVRILSASFAEDLLADQTKILKQNRSSGPRDSPSPYDDPHLGLCCIGELQRKGVKSGKWFDGVSGVHLWGGAGCTAFKYDPNHGKPILAILMTQALPQDDGDTISRLVKGVRQALLQK